MKDNNYISGFEEVKDGRFSKLKVSLSKKINDIGVIKPRYAIKLDEFQKYETRFIPSKDFGVLILSTPKGILEHIVIVPYAYIYYYLVQVNISHRVAVCHIMHL